MLHEVLFQLWNGPGNLSTSEQWFDDVELSEFLHPGERKLLQKIKSIALLYHEIENFRKSISNQHTASQQGNYIKAFCLGLDEVLENYRNEIVNMENKFLNNTNLTLVFVYGSVQKYSILFDILKKVIDMVKVECIHGGLLMVPLYMYIDHGNPIVIQATTRIIICINRMFYRHLCNWIIYGNIVDDYDEFFICDGKSADDNFLYPDQLDDDKNASNSFKDKRRALPFPVQKFFIKTEILPSIIPIQLAETILFIGRIVWIVRNGPKMSQDETYELQFRRDVWDGKEFEYYQKIQKLENYPLNIYNFSKSIEECRLKLTKYLWTIMVDEAKLLEHVQLVRDYYALGRGELFQHFIVAVKNQLEEVQSEYLIKTLNFIFTDTAAKMYGENDNSYRKFELTLAKTLDKERKKNENPWSRLELNFDIPWPLHIIFHPKSINLYNKLFCFLLRIAKTQNNLNKMWHKHISSKGKIDRAVWTVRHNLMFLVNNLQYYLQVDVIETEFSILKQAIIKGNDFEDIIRLHSKFLSNLLSKAFVLTIDKDSEDTNKHNLYQLPALNYKGTNKLYNIILVLLETCDEFCLIASTWDSELNESEQEQLELLRKQSDSVTDTLLRVLYSIHEKVSGPHILQLLQYLDFNRWYSKSKPDFNLSVC